MNNTQHEAWVTANANKWNLHWGYSFLPELERTWSWIPESFRVNVTPSPYPLLYPPPYIYAYVYMCRSGRWPSWTSPCSYLPRRESLTSSSSRTGSLGTGLGLCSTLLSPGALGGEPRSQGAARNAFVTPKTLTPTEVWSISISISIKHSICRSWGTFF